MAIKQWFNSFCKTWPTLSWLITIDIKANFAGTTEYSWSFGLLILSTRLELCPLIGSSALVALSANPSAVINAPITSQGLMHPAAALKWNCIHLNPDQSRQP
jgi:hypothetical protein